MSYSIKNLFIFLGAILSMVTWYSVAQPSGTHTYRNKPHELLPPPDDSTKPKKKSKRSPKYIDDRYGDPFANPSSRSPMLMGNPSNITTEVELDSNQENYTIKEKVGELDYRTPSTMTFEEYQKYRDRESIRNYWKSKQEGGVAGSKEGVNVKNALKTLRIPVKGLEGPFGSNFVDIKPNGLVTLDFSGRWQRVNNPIIPVRQQRNGGFEFDQQISMNVVGKIGEKLKLTANWDTKAAFEFQNNIKLEYTGFDTDILQKIEAGYVNMPLNSSLITGAQNLFGIKTKMQFGRLGVTSVISSQRGKVEELKLPAGSQTRDFEVRADSYDENRHFFLGQFFRSNYEKGLAGYPALASGVKVTKVNVYVTNRVNNTQYNKNIVAYMDLGENQPYRTFLKSSTENVIRPTNDSSSNLLSNPSNAKSLKVFSQSPSLRDPTIAPDYLSNTARANFNLGNCDTCTNNFVNGVDYQVITSARMLQPTDYQFNSDLGYISLNTPLTAQDILAVAYEYSYTNGNGKTVKLKVGEVVGDQVVNDSVGKTNKAIVLKLIKPVGVLTKLPTWNLMMKNIYSLGATQVSREGFQLRVIYKDDRTGLDVPYLQDLATTEKKVSLIKALGIDRLNPNNDPPSDGNFDFVEGITIDTRYGRVIFPVLEPFGNRLDSVLKGESEEIRNKYVFKELYQKQLGDVRQIAGKNKFFLKGRMQSTNSSDIQLSGINIAQGSVTVFAGSNQLVEGTHFTVDYGMARVKIIDQGILTSGQEIRVKYEKQDLFNFRRKTFLGTRLDYKVNNDINLGGTFLHQTESPQITRTNVGDEPSSNNIWGLDLNFKKESRFITKMIDKLPIIQTKEPSQITFSGEVAQLVPGHPKVIDKGENGTAFVDDFEGAETPFDLTRQTSRWRLSATPKITNPSLSAADRQTLLEDFNAPSNNLQYGHHRAKLAWYTIDNLFYGNSSGSVPANITTQDKDNIFIKQIQPQEIFPNQSYLQGTIQEPTLDLAYFPADRGPYNYNIKDLTNDGKLGYNRKMSWAGITRDLRNDIDFDNANIQYMEFWMMNPFYAGKEQEAKYKIPLNQISVDGGAPAPSKNKVPDAVKSAGKLYINLGEISEDVIKDGLQMFENGLPYDETSTAKGPVKETSWGKVPTTQFITNAFPSIAGARAKQDVGLDGIPSAEEQTYYKKFVDSARTKITDPVALNLFLADPSADDFKYYLGEDFDNKNLSILQRYLNIANMENNSPESTNNKYTPSNNPYPDNEDLNQDNTLNTSNNYYEYEVPIDPKKFQIGDGNYIIAKQVDSKTGVEYLQFRIPIRGPSTKVGSIEGYKSIRFVRMYLTGFEEPIILRFARMQLVANQWRVFSDSTVTGGVNGTVTSNNITVGTVNVEENSTGIKNKTSSYQIPPGFSRDQDVTSQNFRQLNEQSLRLCLDDYPRGLPGGGQASAFRNVTYDMLNYGRLRMFVHAESAEPEDLRKNLSAFIRLGTDFTENYYEIEVPLKFSDLSNLNPSPEEVWPAENNLNINLKALPELKAQRNGMQGTSFSIPFGGFVDGKRVFVKGNPDLSSIQVIMVGISNTAPSGTALTTGCIWVDEMRLTDFVEEGGWATTGRMNIKLADVANITTTLRYTGVGFGSIDQKVSQRQRVNTLEWGVQGNMGLDRFLPQSAGIRLPFYASYNTRVISPKYNPLDPDVLLTSALKNIQDPTRKEAYRKIVVDEQIIKSINLTNIQKVKTKPDAKSHFYDVENLSLSAGYNVTTRTNSSIYDYYNKIYTAGLGYTFNNPSKPFEPFKNSKILKSPYLKLVKDINMSFLPTSVNFRSDFNRRLTKTQFYEGNPLESTYQDPFFEKAFTFVRTYGLVWSLTRSITINYSANTNAIIDEPNSAPDSAGYNKVLWENVKRLGRTKGYNQSINATYKIPFDKLPITEWLSTDLNYTGTFAWVAGANSQRDTMGNLLAQNTRDMGLNANISLDRIYNKLKFLREILNPVPKPEKPPVTDPKLDTAKKEEPKREFKALKGILRLAMSAKRVSLSYKINEGTRLPGYKGTANIFGLDRQEGSSIMLPFVLGWQDYGTLRSLSDRGMIANSSLLTDPYTYTHKESFSAQTTLDPIRDFNVTLKMNSDKTNNYSELFHFDKIDKKYVSSNPIMTGGYNISMIFIGTAFAGKATQTDDPTSSKAFTDFENNRSTMRGRLLQENEGLLEDSLLGPNSQDILVPAFLASYRGQNINTAKLNPFPSIPLPNWSITYSGLSKIKSLKKWFTGITLTHTYNANYAVSTFTSSNIYGNDRINPFKDPSNSEPPNLKKNGNYVPVYTMDMVTIKESFSPLIGVNVRTKGKASFNVQYIRDRGLTLSMANAQVQETRSQGFTFGVGWNKTGLKIPFKWQGRQIAPLKNEATFKVDATVRDNLTIQRNINGASTITAGNITLQLRPTVSYMVSPRVTLMFYFDRNVTIPRISSQFRRGVTQFGLQLRFTLS